ncbi:hypothetical protein [Paenibacillus alkalitolerans]|uniref:hypothetical protein n=1 Tax=Paenibacillus alkalitolerans TaxID=2799335 RepID=UPI0018F66A19|nr:hypothetical protein [Paenibacillus alkalitolerans]
MLERRGFALQLMMAFKKKFDFSGWSARMNLSEERQTELERIMIQSPNEIKRHLNIIADGVHVDSFEEEGMLIKAIKK